MTSDNKAKIVAHVVLFLQKIGRRNPTPQVRTDGEVPLERLVGDAVQQVKKSGESEGLFQNMAVRAIKSESPWSNKADDG